MSLNMIVTSTSLFHTFSFDEFKYDCNFHLSIPYLLALMSLNMIVTSTSLFHTF